MHDKIVALGLDEETTAKVENVLKEIIKDSYVPLSRFNEINDAKKKLDETIAKRDEQLAELSQSANATDDLKRQIEQLQAENIQAKKDYDTEVKRMKTDSYINDVLLENGVIDAKFIPAIRAYLPSVDIDSEDSKTVFVTKIGEVKTFLPTMFKTTEPSIETKGLHITPTPDTPQPTVKKDGSWESYLQSYMQS